MTKLNYAERAKEIRDFLVKQDIYRRDEIDRQLLFVEEILESVALEAKEQGRQSGLSEAIKYVEWKMQGWGKEIAPAAKAAFEAAILTIKTADMPRASVMECSSPQVAVMPDLDCRDFYELCQLYRHAPADKPAFVVEAFDELKTWIRSETKLKTLDELWPSDDEFSNWFDAYDDETEACPEADKVLYFFKKFMTKKANEK